MRGYWIQYTQILVQIYHTTDLVSSQSALSVYNVNWNTSTPEWCIAGAAENSILKLNPR